LTTPFQGWRVVGAGFFNAMLMVGATAYSFGLFVLPLQAEFGLSREQANLGLVLLIIGFAVWAPIIGRLIDRRSARTIGIIGAALFAAGFAAIALAGAPWAMALALAGPVALGSTAAGAFAANTVAARWFVAKRGRALGIVSVATSAGGFVVVPVMARLVEALGWRDAVLAAGLGIGALVALATWGFIRDRPADAGQFPDGADAAPAVDTPDDRRWTVGEMLKARNFWLVGIGAGLLLGSDQALLVSLVPYGVGRGFSVTEAANLIAVLTGSAVVGKLIIGWLADRIDKRALFGFTCLCNIAFLLLLRSEPSYGALVAAASVIGLAIGGVYPAWTTLTAQCFGRVSFGQAYGLMNLVTMPFVLASITLAGRSLDATGSYDLAFAIFLGSAALAAVLVGLVRQPGGRGSNNSTRMPSGSTR
jgi:MFS family permease